MKTFAEALAWERFERKGLCHCGCGQATRPARATIRKHGHVKGKAQRYIVGHARRTSPIDYVIEDRGYTTPCWIWKLSTDRNGYGRCRRDGERLAHRWAYRKFRGEIPADREIDHLCRNTSCVNPDHLEVVTAAVNMQRNSHTKLTRIDADEIRASGESYRVLGARYGVSHCCIGNIKRNETWQ